MIAEEKQQRCAHRLILQLTHSVGYQQHIAV
jgi:hypothetical protein